MGSCSCSIVEVILLVGFLAFFVGAWFLISNGHGGNIETGIPQCNFQGLDQSKGLAISTGLVGGLVDIPMRYNCTSSQSFFTSSSFAPMCATTVTETIALFEPLDCDDYLVTFYGYAFCAESCSQGTSGSNTSYTCNGPLRLLCTYQWPSS